MEGKANLRVMTIEAMNWRKRFFSFIKSEELKKLMKEKRVAGNVVKMMEHGVLKKLWKEDREIFDIVVNEVKNKCNLEAGGGEVSDATEDADYKKIAKVASDVMKDIAEEFKFLNTDDAAVAVVNLLNDEDLEKLTKDGDEIALFLSKGEVIVRNKNEQNDHDEEEFLLPKHDEDVQPASNNIIKEKVRNWRKHMGSLMAFVDNEKFRKGLPDGANLGLQVMDVVLGKNSGSEVEENGKPHRYCGWCVVRFEFYSHRHDMSELAKIMVGDINETLIKECPLGRATKRKRPDEYENIPGEFKEGLESREELVKKILIALKDDQTNIVGVFGMGGGGKTTLVKEIANQRVCDLFKIRVVVEVSEAPNIKGIQDQIAEGIGLSLEDVHSVAQRARNIYNSLKSQKILIVLDNVWKKLKLGEVGIPRESTEDFYCKLLITTREKQVCKDMNVKEANIFEVGMLNEKEALDLFQNQTGEKIDNEEFKPVVDRLLKKCGGLPLAIVATSSVVKGKKLPMWCQFAETSEKPILCQVNSDYHEVYSILETSFKLMDNKEKRIFFFLACLSPLDSSIAVEDLMRYGIGLDLFQRVSGLSEALKQASEWTNELVSASLLLKDESNGQVKIHDVVRASAISFIDKGNDHVILVESIPRWMSQQSFKKFKAISLLSGNDFSRLSGVKAPMLQILLLKGDISSTSLPSDFFVGMKNLKILSLSNINFSSGLPESMGHLQRLKTLHLHNCKLKDVKLIGMLVNLLVLSLRGSSLEELAIEIGDLCKLRLLDIEGCKGLRNIPANILSRLSHLEGLYMLNVFDGWASTNIEVNPEEGDDQASGSELDTLSHLNVLEMEVSEAEQLLTANNGQYVEQLGKFKIRVRNSYEWGSEEISECRYILELKDINTVENNWLRAVLKKADFFLLTDCPSFSENLVPLFDEEGFKDLRNLVVEDCNFKCIVSSSDQDESMVFANLELLRINSMDNLEMICDGKAPAALFSNLQRLFFYSLPKLKYGLPLASVRNLNEVYVSQCESLEFIFNKDTTLPEDEAEIILFPHLKSIKLMDVQRLSSLVGRTQSEMMHTSEYLSQDRPLFDEKSLGPPSIFAALVQLEHLSISYCKNMEEVITKETERNGIREGVIAFPQLKHLCLEKLDILEKFYGGSYKLEFPKLKSLKFSRCTKMTNFDGAEISNTLFSVKIEFPCLEDLQVVNLSSEVVRLWNWSSSGVEGETESGSHPSDPVPSLQKLELKLMQGLMSIPHFVSHKLTHLDVSVSPLNRDVFWSYSQFLNLADLSVGGYHYVEQLFENEDDTAVVMLCERLIKISLVMMPIMKILPWHLLKNIRTLYVSHLKWKYLFSADLFTKGKEQLQQLEYLMICRCKDMEVIIMDELDGDGEDTVYCFPRLKKLELDDVNITKFVSKPNSGLHFQSLQSIEFTGCDKVHSFCSGPFRAPKLKEVELWNCESMEYFLSDEMNEVRELPSLTNVEIKECPKMLSFSSKPLKAPKLHSVILKKSGKMRWFSPGDPNCGDILELPSLERVIIEKCWGMQSFSSGGLNAPYLCQMKVDVRDFSKCTTEQLQYVLENLQDYHRRISSLLLTSYRFV
ncbi:uncharacterized protein LOC141614017 isoform X2 [Silene latifolia]|uniref:uncharacterized protein LOC141614017 isoform X2 n=1 Tax=Silene latifolia TaxID=37657 RepID=UPI003D774C83